MMISFTAEKKWVCLVLFAALLCYIIIKIRDNTRYWKKRGIRHLKPWPVVGNFGSVIFRRKHLAYFLEDSYKSFPNKRFFGMHQFNVPVFVVRDLDLIKSITIKDFDHFVNHTKIFDPELEPLFGKNLALLEGEKWKNMRATLSPSFTGNKIRIMFTLMAECAKQFNKFFLEQKEDTIEVEMKELTVRVANDVIASCAFGVQCDSIRDRDNAFYKAATKVTTARASIWLTLLIQKTMPAVAKKFNLSIIPSDVATFFTNAMLETIRTRKEKNIIRPDMIHLLMETMKGKTTDDESKNIDDAGFAAVHDFFDDAQKPFHTKQELTMDDIIPQAFLFFIAGFETVSVLFCHCLHELAVNPDIQAKLQSEIDREFEKSNGDDLSYEIVANMKYLDMVISETLRKWPAGPLLDRVCVKDFLIQADETRNEKAFLLEKGSTVHIPVYGIHRDPKYYPEPERFDPERFSDENKGNIVPYSYIPFGSGPRNCIGSRFALAEVKTLTTYILSQFTIVPTSKTEITFKLSPKTNSPIPKAFWLGLKKRQNT